MKGQDIKELFRERRIKQYEVAAELKVNEFTLSRWLRDEVEPDREKEILAAVNRIVEKERITYGK